MIIKKINSYLYFSISTITLRYNEILRELKTYKTSKKKYHKKKKTLTLYMDNKIRYIILLLSIISFELHNNY